MKVKFIINHYDTISDGQWSSTPTNIVEAFDVGVALAEGDLNDTFSFKLPNPRNAWSGFFKQQDNMQVYYDINSSGASSSTLLINGLVKQVDSINESGGKYLMIKGVSFSEISTNALVFYPGDNVDVMEFLQGALQSVSLRNPNFKVGWNINNPTVKGDGSAFPKLNNGNKVREFDKSLNSILNKYLTNQYTSDGNYYWYINNSKELVIRRRNSVVTHTVVEGVDFRTNRVTISDDIKNFIVVKCGMDAEGRPISTRYFDAASMKKYGFKYYLLTRTNIAPDLITAQGFGASNNYPSTYPYVSTWGVKVNSDSEWNQAVRDKARIDGAKEGENYASLRTKGLINVNLNFKPGVSFKIGDVLSVTIPSYDLVSKSVRVKSLKYNINGVDVDAYEEVVV